MCSPTTECVLLLQNVFFVCRYLLGKGRVWRVLDWALWIFIFAAFQCRMTAFAIMAACHENARRAEGGGEFSDVSLDGFSVVYLDGVSVGV